MNCIKITNLSKNVAKKKSHNHPHALQCYHHKTQDLLEDKAKKSVSNTLTNRLSKCTSTLTEMKQEEQLDFPVKHWEYLPEPVTTTPLPHNTPLLYIVPVPLAYPSL